MDYYIITTPGVYETGSCGKLTQSKINLIHTFNIINWRSQSLNWFFDVNRDIAS